jgi:hypothetical protein
MDLKQSEFSCTFPAQRCKSLIISGAGEGNRTLVSGLGSPHSTIEPHPLPMIALSDVLGLITNDFSFCNTGFLVCAEFPIYGLTRGAGDIPPLLRYGCKNLNRQLRRDEFLIALLFETR